MDWMKKLIELLPPIKREYWIPILLAILLGGGIGGWFYQASLEARIETYKQQIELLKNLYEEQNGFYREQIRHLEDQLKNVQSSKFNPEAENLSCDHLVENFRAKFSQSLRVEKS